MKKLRLFALTLMVSLCTGLSAQEVADDVAQTTTVVTDETTDTTACAATHTAWWPIGPFTDVAAPGLYGFSPLYGGWGGASMRLHEGFNVSLGMSLTIPFGKNAPRGVGFGRDITLAYVKPLSERWTLAAGVYAAGMSFGGWNDNEVGLSAALAYQLSDRVTLYGYGTKSLLSPARWRADGVLPWMYRVPKDRFGAMAEWKPTESLMIQVSVEKHNY